MGSSYRHKRYEGITKNNTMSEFLSKGKLHNPSMKLCTFCYKKVSTFLREIAMIERDVVVKILADSVEAIEKIILNHILHEAIDS